jgi:predicted PurR-regulated permease PerM
MRIDWSRWQTVLVCLVLSVVLLVALGYALALISHTLLLFAFAAILTLVLMPIADLAERHHMPHWLAVVLTYLGFVIVVVGGSILLFAPLVSQVVELVRALPGYVAAIRERLNQLAQGFDGTVLDGIVRIVETQVLPAVAGWSAEVLGGLLGILGWLGSSVTDAILILIISIYMLASGRRIHRSVRGVVPKRYVTHYVFLTSALTRVLGGYIRGQLVLALILGGSVWVGLTLLGMPYALLLAILATILGMIPMFGSALSAVPALLVSLTQPFPTPLLVLILFIILQNVQDQVLAPRISGESVGLHPLAVMFALLAGAQLAGAVGAIFALPVAGFFWIIIVAVYRSFMTRVEELAEVEPPATTEQIAAPQPAMGATAQKS